MYWDPAVYQHFDIKLFIREGFKTLKWRREHRNGYVRVLVSIMESHIADCFEDVPVHFKYVTLSRVL